MHTYSILSAIYDYKAGADPNPLAVIYGSVDGGKNWPPLYVYYDQIMQAFAAAGTSGVQQLLGPMLLRREQPDAPPYPPVPTFPAAVVAPPTAGTSTVFTTALV